MTSLSNSARLRAKIRLAEPGLLAISNEFWRHAELADIFPEFLFMMHSIIRSSVSLINAAAESAQDRANEDAVCAKIASYYAEHAVEETNHDEWLLDDLASIGLERLPVLARLPSDAVASLVGAQYYWALHVHPVALFGYLAVLEGNPASIKELNEIRDRGRIPAVAMRTMLKHAHLDPHHRDEMFALFDELELTESHAELTALSAFHAIEYLSQAFEEILEAQGISSSAEDLPPRAMAAGAEE